MIKTHIGGIPCQVKMIGGYYLKPMRNKYAAPSDIDYYGGWQDVEFEVYDRKGYKALWLEKKMTEADRSRIVEEIIHDNEN